MRKIIVSEFITLDGITEAPDKWSFPFWDDDIGKFKHQELFSSGGLLLGKTTYQGFAAAWPTMKDTDGYADRMNTLPKFVVSTSLKEATWKNTKIIKENIVERITKLKAQEGQDLLVFGSVKLIHMLMHNNLIDEYNLLVYPLVLGKGKHLFTEQNTNLELIESKTFSKGVVLLRYKTKKE